MERDAHAARDGGAALEVELKLAGSPADLRTAFQALDGGPETARRLRSTYHDTDRSDLWRRGLTLRVREPGASAAEVTLKEEGGGNVRRREWTVPAPGGGLDAYHLPQAVKRARLAGIAERDLVARFETDVLRRSKDVCFDDTRVEVSLDTGRITAAGRRVAVAELEFELVRGSAATMFLGARCLVDPHRLVVGSRSKAARGMALLDTPTPVSKAQSPTIRASDTVGRAFGKIVDSIAAHLLGNVDAAAGGQDPEGVHQLRVGLRRLRCALMVFGERNSTGFIDIDRAARRALGELGRARDADVFITEILGEGLRSHEERRIDGLSRAAESHRSLAYEDVRQLLAGETFNTLLVDVMATSVDPVRIVEAPSRPLTRAAPKILAKQHGKVLRAGADFAALTAPQRHRLRIAVKKLRYACAYLYLAGLRPGKNPPRSDGQRMQPHCEARPRSRKLADLHEPSAGEREGPTPQNYVACLTRLQQGLGLANDAIVASRLANDLAVSPGDRDGAALVSDWCRDRLRGMEAELCDAWDSFVAAEPFW